MRRGEDGEEHLFYFILDISLKHIQDYCTNICILSLSRLNSITSKGMQKNIILI